VRFQTTRRAFLGSAAGMVALPVGGAAPVVEDNGEIKLGVASYSLREFSRGLAIKMIRELKAPYVSVKEMHLPYHGTPEDLEKGRKEFEKAGLKIVSGGNNSIQKDDDADVRKFFEYAKNCGMPMLVIAPTHQNMPRVERFVKEYNIKVAIHNHGPEDKHFPTPQSALEVVKNMDARCGLCIDVGHTARTGVDVVKSIAEAGDRLLDIHMKDLTSFKEKSSQCAVGDGVMPVVEIFKQLKKMNYRGCVNLEYESHSDNPLPGMQKSFAYMRGVLAGLRG
jgi:sugar phosphate isomerase/epimerase